MQGDTVALDVTVRVPLKRRDGSVRAWAVIDAADARDVLRFRWRLGGNGYVMRHVGRNGAEYLHRRLLGLAVGDGVQADHRNRDRLDNRRLNLRAGTHAENGQNVAAPRIEQPSSPYRGVCWFRPAAKWMARAKVNGREHYLGYYDDELERRACGLLLPSSAHAVRDRG